MTRAISKRPSVAATLYVLFADYSSNKPLTGLTKIRKELRFTETSAIANLGEGGGYVVGPYLCAIGADGEYKPILDGNSDWPRVPFKKWWEEPVYENQQGLLLKRKNLVFALGNQDGGRHVDLTLRDEAYHWLKEKGDVYAYMHDGALVVYLKPDWAFSGKHLNWRGWGDGTTQLNVGLKWPPPEGARPLKNAHWATMRQMGWEADQAFMTLGL